MFQDDIAQVFVSSIQWFYWKSQSLSATLFRPDTHCATDDQARAFQIIYFYCGQTWSLQHDDRPVRWNSFRSYHTKEENLMQFWVGKVNGITHWTRQFLSRKIKVQALSNYSNSFWKEVMAKRGMLICFWPISVAQHFSRRLLLLFMLLRYDA